VLLHLLIALSPLDAILSPGTALQSTAEDFLEAVDAAPADALKELINFILRCCGCNSSVDSDQVMDSDGIVDCIDEFTEAFKTVRFFMPISHNSYLSLCEPCGGSAPGLW
jgi:hypothetical protein